MLDENALDAIIRAPDNNDRLVALETFADSVLPLYDDVPGVFPEVIRKLVDAAVVAKEAAPAARETPFGALPPTTFADIVEKMAEIIRPYRYVDLELVLTALRELWRLADAEDERKPLLSLAEAIARHDLVVWKRHGPAAQDIIVNAIGALPLEQRLEALPLVLRLLSTVLGSEVEGTTSSSSTLTIEFGPTRASPLLEAIRTKALDLLEDLSGQELSRESKGYIREAFLSATEPPMRGGYGRDLRLIIMPNTERVLRYLAGHINELAFDERQSVEASVHRIFKMNAALPADLQEDEALVSAHHKLLDAVSIFREAASEDAEFGLYKILVGFNSVYPDSWDREEFDWKADEAYREQRVVELLESIGPENSEAWFDRLSAFASTDSNDAATFPVLGKFVADLAQRLPAMVLEWVKRDGPLLDKFLPGILSGLAVSGGRQQANELVESWVEQGVRLGDIAWFLRFADPFDEAVCRRVLERASEVGELGAVRNCIDAAVRQFEKKPGDLIEGVFLPAIGAMSRSKDLRWVRGWIPWLNAPLLHALSEEQASRVLDALVAYDRLEYDAEYIAAAIAAQWPKRVLSFLSDRQAFKRNPDASRYYDSIPFEAHQLREPLSKAPALVIAAAVEWHQKWPAYFQYDGGRLIASVFPNLSHGLHDALYPLVYKNPEFVLAVLASYEGATAIYPIIQAIVRQADGEPELTQRAHDALDESGVVSGEFGFADLHATRREQLRPWLEDESYAVQHFAQEHIAYLDRRIAAETKRAEASIAARKLAFEEDLAEELDAVPDGPE